MTYGDVEQVRAAQAAAVKSAYLEARRQFLTKQGLDYYPPPAEMLRGWDGTTDVDDDRRVFGERDRTGGQKRSIWGQIVDAAATRGISATELVWARFRTDSPTVPLPQNCLEHYAFEMMTRGAEFQEAAIFRLQGAKACDIARFECETYYYGVPADLHAAQVKALYSPSLRVSAFFLYITAKALGVRNAMSQVYANALAQYLLNTVAYDAVYENLVPAEFKDYAQHARRLATR